MHKRLQGLLLAGVAAGLVAGCGGNQAAKPGPVIEKDVAAVIKLPDGSTCTEPPGLAALLEAPGGQLARKLMAEEGKLEDAFAKEKDAKIGNDEIEAAWFDVCRAYRNDEIKKAELERQRNNYLTLRQVQLTQGVKAWAARKDGIKEAGKLCMVVYGESDSARNSTRWVPPETTVDDCALLATRAGAGEVLLGCTEGQWKNNWAKRTVTAGPLGAKSRGQRVRDTPTAPDPNCGWL
jgi:hypothetical protein